jgi:hypothetical protein
MVPLFQRRQMHRTEHNFVNSEKNDCKINQELKQMTVFIIKIQVTL